MTAKGATVDMRKRTIIPIVLLVVFTAPILYFSVIYIKRKIH